MEVRDYHIGDEDKILELFKTTFKKSLSREYWEWRFGKNPAGNYKIKLMWEKDSLIGHYAVSPMKLKIGDKEFNSALSMTTMTHPEYSGRGIFGILANELYSDIEKNDNCIAVWGFPNNNSHYGFIKNLGWSNVSQVMHLTLAKGKILPRISNNVSLNKTFDIEHVNKLQEIYNSSKVGLAITKEYLDWRYIQNPSEKYYLFGINNSDQPAFLIVKLFPTDINIHRDIYITEVGLSLENFNYLNELISHVLAYFNLSEASVNLWLNLFDNRYIQFEKNGFLPGGKPTYLGVKAMNNLKTIICDYRNWYISYGYSDIY